MKALAAIFIALAFVIAFNAQDFGANRSAITELARKFELREQTPPPEWSQRKDAPLFQIAWISDMHIENQSTAEFNASILLQIRQLIHPVALLVSGDSWGMGATPTERQQSLKDFLKACLKDEIHAIVIPGDNWPQGYDTVFGANKFAFTLGGFRFICAAMDAAGSTNGCSRFADDTMEWLKNQFAAAQNSPIIYVQHEPVEPPLTLSAPEVAKLLDQTPNAILALAGHVHLDLAFSHRHWQQWICPTTMKAARQTTIFKVLSFYNDAVICQNWERNNTSTDQNFAPANKFLMAKIPAGLQAELHSVTKFSMDDYTAMPPRPIAYEPSLDANAKALTQRITQFAMDFALKNTRSQNTQNAHKTDDN